jgi:uncharacterized protein (DUF1015 family)
MPKVSPFTGLLFDEDRVGPLESVTAPPYDMITTEEERRFHAASPHNVVRLILDRGGGRDGGTGRQYTSAASHLSQWRDERALVPTSGPAWFPYAMEFSFQARRRRVRGVICAVEIEPWGGRIVPHERTLASPVEDRLRLLRRVRANLSPIYGVVAGPCRLLADFLDALEDEPAARELTDEEGVGHRMWLMEEGGRADGIAQWLADETLLIADGHHRYTTALVYREEMRRAHGPGPWDRMMMLVVDAGTEDPPVLPIHRILRGGSTRTEVRGPRVRDLAEVLATVRDEDLTYGTVQREDGDVVHRIGRLEGKPPTVCALHEIVLGDAELGFTPDAALAEEAVRTGRAPAAFFLPPTHVDRIREVIDAGDRLPQKSTFFWPKPRTGMVIRPHDGVPEPEHEDGPKHEHRPEPQAEDGPEPEHRPEPQAEDGPKPEHRPEPEAQQDPEATLLRKRGGDA